jgi:hypothetical protein
MADSLTSTIGLNSDFHHMLVKPRVDKNYLSFELCEQLGTGVISELEPESNDFEPHFWNRPCTEIDAWKGVLVLTNAAMSTNYHMVQWDRPHRPRLSYEELANRLSNIRRRQELQDRVEQETDWLTHHRAEYAGQWIALSGARLLAHADDATVVFQLVRGLEPKPLIMQIEADDVPFGGW